MSYREPAPRYSRPIPLSVLFPVEQPRGLLGRLVERELADHMTAIGFALGSAAVAIVVVLRVVLA